ncbi:hypothetical protein MLD38_038239 [Melastoma candidum]|uniref:Uncharacterized protein n=1 Tax=Melastoma candidum TaxID=119954 RepID=A0ACB9KZG6_9MYRT|nr:hypothetical protein MLD38_038239 [Melastoma candidum]
MDDGEVDVSERFLLRLDESPGNFPGPTCPEDAFLDQLLKNTTTCTHTHACNPPGPYAAVHTHTCYHTHTQLLPSEEGGNPDAERRPGKAKRPSGNREAVRKYREKKKAHTAYLEEEVQKLRLVNQQLLRKLQGQATLEAEVVRLRSVLVDLRSKIDGELGAFPFQKPCEFSAVSREGDCSMRLADETFKLHCRTGSPCFHPSTLSSCHEGTQGGGKAATAMLSHQGNSLPGMRDGQIQAKANGVVPGDHNGQHAGAV